MSEIYAFPVSPMDGFTQYGMTLRQHYAGLAMQGLLVNSYADGTSQPLSTANAKQIAEMAVSQANELINALQFKEVIEPGHTRGVSDGK